MKRCPECARYMVQKPLFTSLYWECQYCEEKPKPQVDEDTTKPIQLSLGVVDRDWQKEFQDQIDRLLGEMP